MAAVPIVVAASRAEFTCYVSCIHPTHYGRASVIEMPDDSSRASSGAATIRMGISQYAAGGSVSTSHRTGPYTSGGSKSVQGG